MIQWIWMMKKCFKQFSVHFERTNARRIVIAPIIPPKKMIIVKHPNDSSSIFSLNVFVVHSLTIVAFREINWFDGQAKLFNLIYFISIYHKSMTKWIWFLVKNLFYGHHWIRLDGQCDTVSDSDIDYLTEMCVCVSECKTAREIPMNAFQQQQYAYSLVLSNLRTTPNKTTTLSHFDIWHLISVFYSHIIVFFSRMSDRACEWRLLNTENARGSYYRKIESKFIWGFAQKQQPIKMKNETYLLHLQWVKKNSILFNYLLISL